MLRVQTRVLHGLGIPTHCLDNLTLQHLCLTDMSNASESLFVEYLLGVFIHMSHSLSVRWTLGFFHALLCAFWGFVCSWPLGKKRVRKRKKREKIQVRSKPVQPSASAAVSSAGIGGGRVRRLCAVRDKCRDRTWRRIRMRQMAKIRGTNVPLRYSKYRASSSRRTSDPHALALRKWHMRATSEEHGDGRRNPGKVSPRGVGGANELSSLHF